VGGLAEGAVVFYTVKGNTQRIAETIAEACQLPPERLSKERAVDIAPFKYMFFGAPVYNEHFPSAVLQFARTSKWAGKKVAIFSTNIGWKDKRAIEEFAQAISGKGAHVVGSLSIQNRGVLTQVGFGKLTEAEHEKARKWALETQPKMLSSEGMW